MSHSPPFPKSAMSCNQQKEHSLLTPQKDGAGVHTSALLLQHTLGHINCPACEKLRAELICSISPETEFLTAANQWMDSRKINSTLGAISARYIRKTTEDSYEKYIRTLNLFFGGMPLSAIKVGVHFGVYQRARVQGLEPFIRYRRPQDAKAKVKGGIIIPPKGKTPCPAKPAKIKQELNVLILLLKLANCWSAEDEELYKSLKRLRLEDDEEDDIRRALSYEEQKTWLDVARLKTEWNLVYWYSIVAFGTCMSTNELRGLRLGDINLFQRVLIVKRRTSKNKHRSRTIELVGADVLWALEKIIERAAELGAKEPQHYLFPGREHIGKYDPETPMSGSGLNNYWNEVRNASDLKWFRQYDCRHTAITRLAEAGVPTDIIMSRAGHVSEKMRRHYTHISQAAQRRWMEHAHGMSPFAPQSVSYGFSTMAAKRK